MQSISWSFSNRRLLSRKSAKGVAKADDDDHDQKGPGVKKHEAESDSDQSDPGGRDRDPEDVDVRDVRYKLESFVSNCMTLFCCPSSQLLMLILNRVTPLLKKISNADYVFLNPNPTISLLRSALAMKDRNLLVRNMSWIFSPETWLVGLRDCSHGNTVHTQNYLCDSLWLLPHKRHLWFQHVI